MKRVLVVGVLVVGLLAVGLSASAASDAWLPGVASLFIPGLGQFINDQVEKAAIHFIIGAVLYGAGIGYLGNYIPWYYAGTLGLAWSVYSAYDAYTVAKHRGFSIGFVPNGFGVAYSFNF